MKTPLLIAVALFIAAAIPARAVDANVKATITGTVQTEKLVGPSDGRIQTTILNDKRVFQEFGVSKADYELILQLGGVAQLVLLPKHASAMLPTLVVITFGGGTSGEVVNTKTHDINIESGIESPAMGNLFESLAGQLYGMLHYAGSFPPTTYNKFNFNAVATGTDVAGTGAALLKFKVTTGGTFTQTP